MLYEAMDFAATFVFAISGATRGVRRRLDLFGVLVVAWVAAVVPLVAYNKTRLQQLGVPPPADDWTFDDLAEFAPKLFQDN